MFNLLAPVVSVGSSYIAIIDLVALGVLLLALLIGAFKGFLSQVLSVLGVLAAVVLAVMLCDEVSGFIETSFPSVLEGLKTKIGELFGLTDELISGTKEQIIQSLSKTSIPAFLHEVLANAIIKTAGDLNIVNVLAKWALTAISFVSIFVLTLIIFLIIKIMFKSLTKISVIGALDRILGAILMALKFLIAGTVIITVLSLFLDINVILTPIADDGTVVNSVFNSFISWIMQMKFVEGLFV